MSPELESPYLRESLGLAHIVAGAPGVAVLIVAEPGSATENLARLIHDRTARGDQGQFVVVQCRGVPEPALEMELFGDPAKTQGSSQAGAVSRASPGTLFIDRVSDLGAGAQACLAEMMAERERRGVRDSRIVAAATTNLRAAVAARTFRADLLQQISLVTIEMPPLRARPGDIQRLALVYAQARARRLGRRIDDLSPEAIAKLRAHAFEENEHELRVVIERAVIVESSATLRAESINIEPDTQPSSGAFSSLCAAITGNVDRPATLAEMERAYIAWMLRYTNGNRTAASRMLGISYPTIAKKIADYCIDVPAPPGEPRNVPK